jgi:transposase
MGDGPLSGSVGQVLRTDLKANTAQVEVWITKQGRPRRGIAVVTLSLLREAEPSTEPPSPPPSPRRGRPRVISDEKIDEIRTMYETGSYSHSGIAAALGVSKSSVAHYLRRADPTA